MIPRKDMTFCEGETFQATSLEVLRRDVASLHLGMRHYFFNSFNISRAAFAPDPPVSPVPGCVPLPHKYKF